MDATTKAALYLRSATGDDRAIAKQRQICTEHAEVSGYQIVEVFFDAATSGAGKDRPGLDALRECLREGRVSVLLAEEPARLYRDPGLLKDFIGFCDAVGAEISYPRPPEAINDLTARLFAEDAAKKTRRGTRRIST